MNFAGCDKNLNTTLSSLQVNLLSLLCASPIMNSVGKITKGDLTIKMNADSNFQKVILSGADRCQSIFALSHLCHGRTQRTIL